jgi:glucose-1-phosphate thymidylyltransferase
MKGVVLAGGLGTRLRPLTLVTNKHLLPVYDKPMVFYPIKTLVDAHINELLIVAGGPFVGHFMGVLKNGKELGLKHLEYAYQEGEGGISAALSLAEDFADGDSIAVILGDNCTDADISKEVSEFKDGAKIFIKEVTDPERFGVPTFDANQNIIGITEKPKNPDSHYAVTGLYLYDNTVFNRIRELKPSLRGELEVTDLNNLYLEAGRLSWGELKGFWKDAGTFDTLLDVNKYWGAKER